MSLKDAIKKGVYKYLQKNSIDMKSVNNRLKIINARHIEVSGIMSHSYNSSYPTPRLFSVFSQLVSNIDSVPLNKYTTRSNVPEYVFSKSGEHYKLLPVLIKQINAKKIVEIGTFTGLSSVSIFHAMDEGERSLTTVDIKEFDSFSDTVLSADDFTRYDFKQLITDFSDFKNVEANAALLREADLIFCDAPKDGFFEQVLLQNFQKIRIKDGAIILFDDIKQWNMLKIWHEIKMPKLDITAIGHFTGTGMVEWDNSISCF